MDNGVARGFKANVTGKIAGLGPVLALIVLVIIVAVMNPSFLEPNNILNLFRQVSINGLIAFGMTFVNFNWWN
jgi:ribose transport system permease protein